MCLKKKRLKRPCDECMYELECDKPCHAWLDWMAKPVERAPYSDGDNPLKHYLKKKMIEQERG